MSDSPDERVEKAWRALCEASEAARAIKSALVRAEGVRSRAYLDWVQAWERADAIEAKRDDKGAHC